MPKIEATAVPRDPYCFHGTRSAARVPNEALNPDSVAMLSQHDGFSANRRSSLSYVFKRPQDRC
jgi:hypothetical protein